jgi:hypothetical protein
LQTIRWKSLGLAFCHVFVMGYTCSHSKVEEVNIYFANLVLQVYIELMVSVKYFYINIYLFSQHMRDNIEPDASIQYDINYKFNTDILFF